VTGYKGILSHAPTSKKAHRAKLNGAMEFTKPKPVWRSNQVFTTCVIAPFECLADDGPVGFFLGGIMALDPIIVKPLSGSGFFGRGKKYGTFLIFKLQLEGKSMGRS
jgi:hypothetical protein